LIISSYLSFLVYRSLSSESFSKWLEVLKGKEVPMLVCLTHADRLYAAHMTDPTDFPDVKDILETELKVSPV